MNSFDRKSHWENIYQTKQAEEVGWFQPKPETSLEFFNELNVQAHDSIIDVGGGDSFLVDHLLDLGYLDITVLDISLAAINRAKVRLGERAGLVKWIVSDVLDHDHEKTYDFWHDRAAFHFLTENEEVLEYVNKVKTSLKIGGSMVIGTFSKRGPTKCSGINIRQYSEHTMHEVFGKSFIKTKCIEIDHETPSKSKQNYIFCCFKRII